MRMTGDRLDTDVPDALVAVAAGMAVNIAAARPATVAP